MTREEKVKLALLYCKWCPSDCQGLDDDERLGCLAAGGFVDELVEVKGYSANSEERVNGQTK